jgi:hypothetical protein
MDMFIAGAINQSRPDYTAEYTIEDSRVVGYLYRIDIDCNDLDECMPVKRLQRNFNVKLREDSTFQINIGIGYKSRTRVKVKFNHNSWLKELVEGLTFG